MQLRDQVSNAICELERLLGEHTRHLLLRGLHRAEAEREGLVERHRTAHRLRGQRRNLVTAAEVGGEVVDALGRDNGAVDVEADSLSSAQRGLRMRDAQPDARAHRERAAAEGRRSAKVKDLHKKWLLLVGYGSTHCATDTPNVQAEFPRFGGLRPEICRLAPCIMVHYLANNA